MNMSKKRKKRTRLERNVFREQPQTKIKPNLYQAIIATLMLVTGFTLIIFLNTLPQRLESTDILNESLTKLSTGINYIFQGFMDLGTLMLILLLAVFGLLLTIGGIWRILRLLLFKRKTKKLKYKNKR